MTQRHHEGDGVIAGGVGVDEERSRHKILRSVRGNQPDSADSRDRTGIVAEKCERPGWRSGRGPHAARGSSTWDEPSTIGRPAGVSLSLDLTSPVVPGGSAGDAALSARWPVTRLRSRHGTFHAAPDKSVTPIRHREDRELDEPVGVAPRGLGPATPYDRPANRPAVRRGGWWHSSRAPVPLTPREPGPFSAELTRRQLQQTRIPSPGWRCAFRYAGHIRGRITPGQERILEFTGFSPKICRYPQERRVHPPFMHRNLHNGRGRELGAPTHRPPAWSARGRGRGLGLPV